MKSKPNTRQTALTRKNNTPIANKINLSLFGLIPFDTLSIFLLAVQTTRHNKRNERTEENTAIRKNISGENKCIILIKD